jgi:hypothetical protein
MRIERDNSLSHGKREAGEGKIISAAFLAELSIGGVVGFLLVSMRDGRRELPRSIVIFSFRCKFSTN